MSGRALITEPHIIWQDGAGIAERMPDTAKSAPAFALAQCPTRHDRMIWPALSQE
jgi:hypothetical protein